MHVVINGENAVIEEPITIAELLEKLQVEGKLAVEVNKNIIPSSQHHETVLKTNDHVEIVQAIGGG